MGLLSVVVSQLISEKYGIPYRILLYVFRNDNNIREMGYLTVNETIGYGWGRIFFWRGLVISFIVTSVLLSLIKSSEN
jgi:hypothetical protein